MAARGSAVPCLITILGMVRTQLGVGGVAPSPVLLAAAAGATAVLVSSLNRVDCRSDGAGAP